MLTSKIDEVIGEAWMTSTDSKEIIQFMQMLNTIFVWKDKKFLENTARLIFLSLESSGVTCWLECTV